MSIEKQIPHDPEITIDLLNNIKKYFKKGNYIYRPNKVCYYNENSSKFFFMQGIRITYETNHYHLQQDMQISNYDLEGAEEITKEQFNEYRHNVENYYKGVKYHLLKENLFDFEYSPVVESKLRLEIITCLKYRTDPKINPDFPVKYIYVFYAVTDNAYRMFKLDIYNDIKYVNNDMVITFTEQQLTLDRDLFKDEYFVAFFNSGRISTHNFDDTFGKHFAHKKLHLLTETEYNKLSEFFKTPFQPEDVSMNLY